MCVCVCVCVLSSDKSVDDLAKVTPIVFSIPAGSEICTARKIYITISILPTAIAQVIK